MTQMHCNLGYSTIKENKNYELCPTHTGELPGYYMHFTTTHLVQAYSSTPLPQTLLSIIFFFILLPFW